MIERVPRVCAWGLFFFVGGGRDGRLTGQLHVRAGAVASPAVLVVHGGRVAGW